MKYIQYFLISIFIASSALASAQSDSTVMDKTINITKDFRPEIENAGKVNELPAIVEPEIDSVKVNYVQYSTIIETPYDIRTLGPARIKVPPAQMKKDGYIRLGVGNRYTTLGDFMYPLLKNPKNRLDFDLHHLGTFNENMHHDNKGALAYRHYYTTGELSVDATYRYQGFNYYAKSNIVDSLLYSDKGAAQFLGKELLPDVATITNFNAGFGYASLPSITNYKYKFRFDFDAFRAVNGLSENESNTKFNYEQIAADAKVGVDFKLTNLVYSNVKAFPYADAVDNYSLLSLNPYYTLVNPKWKLRIGVNAAIPMSTSRKFAPSADIKGEATLIDKTIFVYGGIVGDYSLNTMSRITDENRYITLREKIKDTYTPFDGYAGMKLKLLSNFLIDVSARYKVIKDQYFFVNDSILSLHAQTLNGLSLPAQTWVSTNTFTAEYADANLFVLLCQLNYNMNHQFTFTFDYQYNKWNVKTPGVKAWQMPKHEFDFSVETKLSKRTSFNLTTYTETGRVYRASDGSSKKMKSIVDVNFGLFYAHNSKVSSFIKLNNILHQEYAYWSGYEVNGFNGLIGITYAF